jgi:uncharacterized protein
LRQALALIVAFNLMSACSPAEPAAQDAPALELTGRVVDAAQVLEPEAERRLTEKLDLAERKYGPQMVIVTTPSLKGAKVADYSIKLARAWGVGDKQRNDGLVLLIAPNERVARIEVGYGLEGSFSDDFAGEILRKHIFPQFEQGDFAAGIEAGVDRMIEKMKAVPTIPANDNPAPNLKDKAA